MAPPKKKRTPPTVSSGSKSASSNSPSTTKRNSSSKSKSKKKGSFFRKAFKWTFVLGLWVGIVLACILAYYATELPDITKSAAFERQSAITVKAADGSIIARYGEIKGNSVKFEDIPQNLKNAVMAIEDRRFYSHFGLDPLGLLRAIVVNIKEGGVVQGGSTITQQLAKNLFLSHDRTLKRKIQEAMLAIWLEHQLTKDEILSAYLNRVYLGSGTYGIDAASELYFDKEPKDMTLRESATIAGLLKAPSRYSPRRNPGLANERADVVLMAMADAGYITEEQAKGMSGVPPKPPQKPSTANAERYFSDWIVDGLDDLIGTPETDLIVHTTLVPSIQNNAQAAVSDTLAKEGAEKNIGQGAAIVMSHDGAVLALVGGRDYNKSQFNRITQAQRQPGSSFKPFVYLTALEHGYTPLSTIIDEPITQGRYRPANFGNEYYGLVNLETALTFSLNTVAVNLTKELGVGTVIETARRLGIISDLPADLSMALGTASISPLELAAAYAVIANGGYRVFPYGITKIEDKEGKQYYQRPSKTVTRQVINTREVFELQQMMRSVVDNGTGRGAAPGFPAAGKTGTSSDFRDAWFAGYTNKLVAIAWVGNDDNSPMKKVTGGSTPARIWRQIVSKAQYDYKGQASFSIPDSDGFQAMIGRLFSRDERTHALEEENRMRFGNENFVGGRNNPRSSGYAEEQGYVPRNNPDQEDHEDESRYNN